MIAGLVAEVEAIRAAYDLAAAAGGCLGPLASDDLYADLAALAATGAMTTTLAEASARADVVLAVGEVAGSSLLATLVQTGPHLGRAAGVARTMLTVGPETAPATAPDLHHRVEPKELPAALCHLRALAGGRLSGEGVLAAIADRLSEARFAVLAYRPGEIGDLAVEMLHGLAKDLSQTTRVFALPFSDPWQTRAVREVGAWTTGQAPRVGFGRGRPEHDAWRFDAARAAGAGELDAVVWLASLPAPRPDWSRTLPDIAILGEAKGDEASIVFDVGVPGQDVPGTLWHDRRGVLVFRAPAREGSRPRAATILKAIAAALPARIGPSC